MEQQKTRMSGFASMDSNKQKEIARKGGMAAHRKGTAHEFTADEARAAGRKGGERVSSNRSHMVEIGRLGGKRSAERRRANAQSKASEGGGHHGESSAQHGASHAGPEHHAPQHAHHGGHEHAGAHAHQGSPESDGGSRGQSGNGSSNE